MTKRPRMRSAISNNDATDSSAQDVNTGSKSSQLRKFGGRTKNIGILQSVGKILSLIFRPVKKILSLLVPRYFVNSWKEVMKVSWPDRKETWRLTGAVLIFAIVFGSLVAGVDKGLDELFKKVILK